MAKSILDLIPDRIFDENAYTLKELAAARGMNRMTMTNRIEKLMEDGNVEQVWKRSGGKPVRAFRLKS